MLIVPRFVLLATLLPFAFLRCQLVQHYMPLTNCHVNQDCRESQVCYFGECIVAQSIPKQSIGVDLVVASESKDMFSEQHLVDISHTRFPVSLAPRIPVWGELIKPISQTQPVKGTLLLTRDSLWGQDKRELSIRVEKVKSNQNTTFFTQLEQGQYQVSFLPDEDTFLNSVEQLPSFNAISWQVDDSSKNFRLDYPDKIPIRGKIVASVDNPLLGMSDVRVHVTKTSDVFAFSSTETDALGFYQLLIPRGIARIDLHVTPSDKRLNTPHTVFKNLPVDEHGQVPVQYLGELGSSIQIVGQVRAPSSDIPVVGVYVYAQTSVGEGLFSTGSVTDKNGRFVLNLLRGTEKNQLTYRFFFIPPTGSLLHRYEMDYAIRLDSVMAPPNLNDPLIVSLGLRSMLTLQIRSASLKNEPFAHVSLIPYQSSMPHALNFEITADKQGHCALPVDDGVYTLFIRPAVQSTSGWTYQRLEFHKKEQSVLIKLNAAWLVAGEIKKDNIPLQGQTGMRINFYWRRAQGDQIIKIAESIVDTYGHFNFALPQYLEP